MGEFVQMETVILAKTLRRDVSADPSNHFEIEIPVFKSFIMRDSF